MMLLAAVAGLLVLSLAGTGVIVTIGSSNSNETATTTNSSSGEGSYDHLNKQDLRALAIENPKGKERKNRFGQC